MAEEQRRRRSTELIHEGKYAAEVVVELSYSDESWSPTMSIDDARKLERVRLALRCGDLAEAAKARPGVRAYACGVKARRTRASRE
jgi:hypothetical protein